jgi:CHAT domain-containing protein
VSPKKKLQYAFLVAVLVATAGLAYWCVLSELPGNHPSLEDPKSVIAEADRLFWLGNLDAAGRLYARAEQLFHQLQDPRNEIYAHVGWLRTYPTGMPLKEISKLLKKYLGDPIVRRDPSLRLWCLTAKGYIDFDIDSESAKQTWIQALQLAGTLGDRRWASRARGELGLIAFVQGNTSLAVSLVGNALWSAYRLHDVGAEIEYLSMAGTGFVEERRFSEGLPFFRIAIAMTKITPDSGFPYSAYEGQAACLLGMGKEGEARKLLQKILSKARADGRLSEVARILIQLGDTSASVEDVGQAENEYREAGQIFQNLGVSRGLDEALFKLAGIYRQQGRLEEAAKVLRTGLPSLEHIDHYYLARLLTALAELAAAQKRPRKADRLFEQAEDTIDSLLTNLHSDFETAAVSGAMSETYIEHFKLVVKEGNAARAFHILERVRGNSVRTLSDPAAGSEREVDSTSRFDDAIAKVQRTLLNTEDYKLRSALVDELTAYERVRAFVDNESTNKRREVPKPPPSLGSVRHALREDELLVEYVLNEPASFCIAVTRRKAKVFTLASGKKKIEGLTTAYLKQLAARVSGFDEAIPLYAAVLEPILTTFPKARLIVSPDGVLYQLPFEALRSRSGELLIRSKTFSYTPSASTLLALRNAKEGLAPHLLLAVGAVHYQPAQSGPAQEHTSSPSAAVPGGLAAIKAPELGGLPESREELFSIARQFPEDAVVLLGAEATESAFKRQPLSDYRIIHLAVHAFPDSQHPQRASLVLGTDPKTREDGLLQVSEITRLHLRADLVTLSGCETRMGPVQGEAGMSSLEQAFLLAGARAVVASLWSVEDHSTTALMKSFYAHIAQGEDKASALADAKRDILRRYGDISPHYWAGFVMAGDGTGRVAVGR